MPCSFHVRVEATDKAGNVGSKDTANPVIVDLHIPKGFIKNVDLRKECETTTEEPEILIVE